MSKQNLNAEEVRQWLQNQENRNSIGIKYVPRARVSIKQKGNLNFNDRELGSFTLVRKEDDSIHLATYGRASMYAPSVACEQTKNSVKILIDVPYNGDAKLFKDWFSGKAKPTEVAKPESEPESKAESAPSKTEYTVKDYISVSKKGVMSLSDSKKLAL